MKRVNEQETKSWWRNKNVCVAVSSFYTRVETDQAASNDKKFCRKKFGRKVEDSCEQRDYTRLGWEDKIYTQVSKF